MELLSVDRVVADIRLNEARQDAISQKAGKRANYISAEVLTAEFKCRAQDISDLLNDDEFKCEVCFHLAAFIRDPKNIGAAARLVTAFDRAIEDKAGKEYDDWRAA